MSEDNKKAAWRFVRELSEQQCQGAYIPKNQPVYRHDRYIGCGRCPSCRAREFLGKRELYSQDVTIVCEGCGLTA